MSNAQIQAQNRNHKGIRLLYTNEELIKFVQEFRELRGMRPTQISWRRYARERNLPSEKFIAMELSENGLWSEAMTVCGMDETG